MFQVAAKGKEEELTLLAEINTSQQHNKLCRALNPFESACLRLHCLNILGWLGGRFLLTPLKIRSVTLLLA